MKNLGISLIEDIKKHKQSVEEKFPIGSLIYEKSDDHNLDKPYSLERVVNYTEFRGRYWLVIQEHKHNDKFTLIDPDDCESVKMKK